MRKSIGLFLLPFILLGCTRNEQDQQENWIQLFNGENLEGWDFKISGHPVNDNYKNTFVVEDGILKINYDEYDSFRNKFSHIYYKNKYSHYRLRIEYRMVGIPVPGGPVWAQYNSGVMLHSQSAQSQELNQNFPASIEMQFLGAMAGEKRTNGNLASPGTHVWAYDSLYTNHMLYSNSKAPVGEDWISVEAIVLGDSIVHHVVEGDTVLTYEKPVIGGWEVEDATGWVEDKSWVKEMVGQPIKEGYIALQGEGHAMHFRKVELLELGKK